MEEDTHSLLRFCYSNIGSRRSWFKKQEHSLNGCTYMSNCNMLGTTNIRKIWISILIDQHTICCFLKLIIGFYTNLLAAKSINVVRNPFITSHLEGQKADLKIEVCDNVRQLEAAQIQSKNGVPIKLCCVTSLFWSGKYKRLWYIKQCKTQDKFRYNGYVVVTTQIWLNQFWKWAKTF